VGEREGGKEPRASGSSRSLFFIAFLARPPIAQFYSAVQLGQRGFGWMGWAGEDLTALGWVLFW